MLQRKYRLCFFILKIFVHMWVNICLFHMHTHKNAWIYRYVCVCIYFSSVQLLSRVWLFPTVMTAVRHASLFIVNSRSWFKLMSAKSVMPSNQLILCVPFSSHLQSCPASGSFQMSQFFTLGGQSIEVSASTSVLVSKHTHIGLLLPDFFQHPVAYAMLLNVFSCVC